MNLRDQQWKPEIYLMALSMILSVNGSPILESRPTSMGGTAPCPSPLLACNSALGRTLGSCGNRSIEFDLPQSKRDARIVGGEAAPHGASYGAYPWQVALKIKGHSQLICGGAIIENRFILTAAHCLSTFWPDGRGEFVVVVGEHDLKANDSKAQVFQVEKFVTHPNYLSAMKGDDIALIKLRTVNEQGIIFNDYVQPICLPNSEEAYQPGTLCSVSGWGFQKDNDMSSIPQILQVANVPILSGETCIRNEVYGNFLNSSHFPDNVVCAGYLEGKTGACSGDSGGPLACKINGQFQLLGLYSWSDDQPGRCAFENKPGVYTKLLRFVDWIQEWTEKM